jgi:hypothetical protein
VSKWTIEKSYPVTNLYMTFYFNNIAGRGLCKPQDDGSYLLSLPAPDETCVPGVPVEQTGLWVKAILDNPDKYKGETCAPPMR